MKYWLVVVLSIVGCQVTAAQVPASDIIKLEGTLDGLCRGFITSDPQLLDILCSVRNDTARLLNKNAYCYGKDGQIGADMRWHRCATGSRRMPETDD
jgi:hypothetical protein